MQEPHIVVSTGSTSACFQGGSSRTPSRSGRCWSSNLGRSQQMSSASTPAGGSTDVEVTPQRRTRQRRQVKGSRAASSSVHGSHSSRLSPKGCANKTLVPDSHKALTSVGLSFNAYALHPSFPPTIPTIHFQRGSFLPVVVAI